MKLSISNIAWTAAEDDRVYNIMKDNGYSGLEIAPTRIFPDMPYDDLDRIHKWSQDIYSKYGFTISSMQSIWYGRTEKIFASINERKILSEYTKKAIDFAAAVNCHNLVFGCPKNRSILEGMTKEQADEIIIPFFKELGDYACERGTVVALEANPPMYNTNFINDTGTAVELIKRVDSKGFLLNLDIGTIIENRETMDNIVENTGLINHVHISEPGLAVIQKRKLHSQLVELLSDKNYDGYVSIEMGKQDDLEILEKTMKYVKGLADTI